MPTASEPRITLRLDHRVHGALLDAAKQAKRKPATLARLILEEALESGAVEQALGAPDAEMRVVGRSESPTPGLASPAPAEPSEEPEWKSRTRYQPRPYAPIPKGMP